MMLHLLLTKGNVRKEPLSCHMLPDLLATYRGPKEIQILALEIEKKGVQILKTVLNTEHPVPTLPPH